MPVRRNDGPRAIARELVNRCGLLKSEARAITGKKWRASHASPRPALSEDQQELFLHALAQGVEAGSIAQGTAAALLLCLVFGLRIAEACSVTQDRLTPRGLRVFGKGEKWRTVPVDLDPRGRKVVTLLQAAPLCSPGQGQRACRWIAERCPELEALTPHVLRHSYATNLLRACTPFEAIQEALGHDNRNTTLTYLHSLREL